MYGLALSLWMIDIHNVIIEVQGTLLSTASDSLDDLYNIALGRVVQLSSVEDVLYAFMVCARSMKVSRISLRIIDQRRGRHHHLASVRVLVQGPGEARLLRHARLLVRFDE